MVHGLVTTNKRKKNTKNTSRMEVARQDEESGKTRLRQNKIRYSLIEEVQYNIRNKLPQGILSCVNALKLNSSKLPTLGSVIGFFFFNFIAVSYFVSPAQFSIRCYFFWLFIRLIGWIETTNCVYVCLRKEGTKEVRRLQCQQR